MSLYLFVGFVIYIVVGILKLRFFDLNGEGDWLLMWSDPRSRRCSACWLWLALFVVWLTWPVILFSRKKYKMVDDEVFRHVPGEKDEDGRPKCILVKTGKKRKLLTGTARFALARTFFHFQWAGLFGVKR